MFWDVTSFLFLLELGCTHGLYISDHLMRSSLLCSLATRAATSQWGSRFHQMNDLGWSWEICIIVSKKNQKLVECDVDSMLDGSSSVEVNWSTRTTCSKVAKVQSLDGQKYLIVQCNCVVQNAAASLCAAGGSWNGQWTTIGMEMQGCHTYIYIYTPYTFLHKTSRKIAPILPQWTSLLFLDPVATRHWHTFINSQKPWSRLFGRQ